MENLNLYILDPETLRDFLVELPAGQDAGVACDDTRCPLARFLSFVFGGSWAVHFLHYERLCDDLLYEVDCTECLPDWAARFVFLVDWFSDFQEVSVSPVAALSYLLRACSEHGIALEG